MNLTVFFLTVKMPRRSEFPPARTTTMLTDVALKQLRLQQKLYKVADRDGMYVAVAPSGQITFRLTTASPVAGRL
jgi:hypothetical protein